MTTISNGQYKNNDNHTHTVHYWSHNEKQINIIGPQILSLLVLVHYPFKRTSQRTFFLENATKGFQTTQFIPGNCF